MHFDTVFVYYYCVFKPIFLLCSKQSAAGKMSGLTMGSLHGFHKNVTLTWHLQVRSVLFMQNLLVLSQRPLLWIVLFLYSMYKLCTLVYIWVYLYPASFSSSSKSPRAAKHTIECASRWERVCCKLKQKL